MTAAPAREATRGITRQLPNIGILRDAGEPGTLRGVLFVAACEIHLTPDQMRALARNLLWTADMIEDAKP